MFILPRLPRFSRPLQLAAVLISATLLLGACGSGSSTEPAVPAGHHLDSIFEAGLQLASDPARTLDTLRRLGVSHVKVFIPWSSVAPASSSGRVPHFNATDPGAYPPGAWDRFDAIVRDAAARGIGVDLTLSSPPVWAAGPGDPDPATYPQWKPSASAFGAFVRAVGERYSGTYKPAGAAAPLPRVGFWSIWNEPNYGSLLAPQAINQIEVSPQLYRELLDAAWSALTATGHGHDTILIGELAPRGQTLGNHPGLFDGMVPLRFVRALYCVDGSFAPLRGQAARARGCPPDPAGSRGFRTHHPALFEAAGFAVHPYPEGGLPPNQVIPGEPDYADLASLPNVERTLDRALQAYGSEKRFPIYSTEFGYQTNPPSTLAGKTSPARRSGVSELGRVHLVAQSARRLVRPVSAHGPP